MPLLYSNSEYYLYSKPSAFFSFSRFLISNMIYVQISFLFIIARLLYSIILFDAQQGAYSLILFIHVPFAWLSLSFYLFASLSSIIYLVQRYQFAYLFTISFVSVGILFTFLTLATGSLWGKPLWGTYWVWDARLTSVFFLFLFYFVTLTIHTYFKNPILSCSFILIGAINIPIIKFSVDWWNTLHQSASISLLHSAIDSSFFLILCSFFFFSFFFSTTLFLLHIRFFLLSQKIHFFSFR